MAILLNPTNVNIEINDDIGLMCISEEFSNHAPRETYLIQSQYEAARAHFQAERDEQLGRWRDPESPDCICYPVAGDPDDIWVVYEGDGSRYHATRTDWERIRPHYVSETARRYFAAHPEPEPWEEAKAGEVWILTRYGAEEPFFVTGGEFTSTDLAVATDLDDPRITAGRRIWPEGDTP